jgi:hypothetical protein
MGLGRDTGVEGCVPGHIEFLPEILPATAFQARRIWGDTTIIYNHPSNRHDDTAFGETFHSAGE